MTGFVVKTMDELMDSLRHIDDIDPEKCRERAKKLFSSHVMVDQYEKVYKEVLGMD